MESGLIKRMLCGLERKVGWAYEHAGESTLDDMQRLYTVATRDWARSATT